MIRNRASGRLHDTLIILFWGMMVPISSWEVRAASILSNLNQSPVGVTQGDRVGTAMSVTASEGTTFSASSAPRRNQWVSVKWSSAEPLGSAADWMYAEASVQSRGL